MTDKKTSWETPARTLAAGIGEAVAARTILRKKEDGSIENWADVAYRVSLGSASLNPHDAGHEFDVLHKHMREASVLMSGRHLQHGDGNQAQRNIEVFSNCSTSASTFILFYLLLNGSGVGRAYDDNMMVVDWSKNLPTVIPVIREDHPDVLTGEIGPEFVNPKWPDESTAEFHYQTAEVFEVPDSREGWAKALEKIEYMTWTGNYADKAIIIDFSHVRERGAPIGGMQNRPASGPGPLMAAIKSIAALKNSGMDAWEATMHADHFSAECVLVGGARRAARMATKSWRDKSVFKFISVKKGGVLWSSNNSVTVDEEFWRLVKTPLPALNVVSMNSILHFHAHAVFEAICSASYHDGTGEPGLINVERLTQNDDGIEALFDGNYAESERFKLDKCTLEMTSQLAKIFAANPWKQITNPCGEISLILLGGYCVIADVVPYHAGAFNPSARAGVWMNSTHRSFEELERNALDWDNNAESAFRAAVRALIRTNTMNALYGKEVERTNRIGVGFTGIHEYAWARFGFGWKDLVNEAKSIEFWKTMGRFSRACVDEAMTYADYLGVAMPHTVTTVKPAGTTSKCFGLTEGAHLPSMEEFLRWVQFRNDDPLIAEYEAKGYPIRRDLKQYSGTTIVGFPTVPLICTLGMGDKLVTAAEATPEEQYEWLRLLEKWWIDGFDPETGERHKYGNQVSYTLKLDMKVVDFEHFRQTLMNGQSTIKCCSVMPSGDTSAYEYLPEDPVSPERFAEIVANIKDDTMKEEIGREHMECAGGACPIEWQDEKAA